MNHLSHRNEVYSFLEGYGLEIGALHQPALVGSNCNIRYCDAILEEEARILFPEISNYQLVRIDYKLDLNREGLLIFENSTYDFIIINHVLEHIINPVYAISEIFRVLKEGGLLVVSVPDKQFIFDKDRPLTPFEVLKSRYDQNLCHPDDSYYEELLNYPHYVNLVHSFYENPSKSESISFLRNRHEHINVWTSESFRQFMLQSIDTLNYYALEVYSDDTNNFEYFGAWQKLDMDSGSILDTILNHSIIK